MRVTVWLCVLSWSLASGEVEAQADSLMALAQAAEAGEAWGEAADYYADLYQEGYRSAELFLNQGNAYLADGQIGRAILAYERGLRIRPGQRDLANNLAVVENELDLQLTSFPEFFLWRWADWLGSRLGIAGAQWVAMICWWLAVGLAGWWLFRRQQMHERLRFWLPPVAVLLLLLFLALQWLSHFRQSRLLRADQAVIVIPQIDMLAAPEPESTYELTAYEGLRVRIIDGFGGYRKVELGNGRRGWVPANSLEVI